MLYIITAQDKPNSLSLRQENRPAHLAYWQSFGDKVRFGGPFLNEKGEMCGSMLAIEAENAAEARQFAAGDPYAKAGLFAGVEVRGWKKTLGA